MKSELHISLTGHRPQKLGGFPGNRNYNERGYLDLQSDLESFILRALDQYDRVICHSGLALGGDTVWSYHMYIRFSKREGLLRIRINPSNT